MTRFGPHPRLTNSYHPSRPSSRPTSSLRAEWVSPVSVLSQPLGQCDGAPKSACDQSSCVHRPLSWDCEPGGQGAFPCFICLLATSLGFPCVPFLSPYSSLFLQSFLPIWLSHWFPLLLPTAGPCISQEGLCCAGSMKILLDVGLSKLQGWSLLPLAVSLAVGPAAC